MCGWPKIFPETSVWRGGGQDRSSRRLKSEAVRGTTPHTLSSQGGGEAIEGNPKWSTSTTPAKTLYFLLRSG
jgi:hypothetical protein